MLIKCVLNHYVLLFIRRQQNSSEFEKGSVNILMEKDEKSCS